MTRLWMALIDDLSILPIMKTNKDDGGKCWRIENYDLNWIADTS